MQSHHVFKSYMTEYTLGFIGAILSVHGFFFSFSGIDSVFEEVTLVVILLLLIAATVSIIGTYQLNKNSRNGGTMLTLAGSMCFLSSVLLVILTVDSVDYNGLAEGFGIALFYTVCCAALLLTGGIRALAKQRAVQPPAAQGWYYSAPYAPYYPTPPVFPPAEAVPPTIASAGVPSSHQPTHSGYTRQPYASNTMPPRR